MAACALALAALPACPSGPRDALGGGGRQKRTSDASAAPASQGYEYVARRPLCAVALAEARGMTDEEAHDAIDQLAERVSRCVSDLLGQGKLVDGGARLVLPIDAAGVVGRPQVVFSPPESAVSGMLCVVASARMINFAPASADAGQRALAVEAAWGREVAGAGAGAP